MASGTETGLLQLLNDVTGPSDLVRGSFNLAGVTDFTLTGFGDAFGNFSGIGAGQSLNGLSVAFNTSTLGTFDDIITLALTGYNESGYSGGLSSITLELKGHVYSNGGQQPVPEPTTMLLLGSGLIGLAGFRKRFKKK